MQEQWLKLKGDSHQYLSDIYARNDVAFESGKGAVLYDVEGRDYIDFGSGIGVNSLGYGNEGFAQALLQQAQKIMHSSNLFHIPLQVELAKMLQEYSGYKMKSFFVNSGAEANEGAIKLARKYGETRFAKKRYKIITLASSFHGRTLATLKATGQEHFHRFFAPFPDGFVIAQDLADIEQKLDDETCAVMIELVQGEGGVRAFPKEEIQRLSANLRDRGILLMIDEVQSGIYRSGECLASQVYGIEPDVIALAKGLGGGVPIGAVMCSQDIFEQGDHGSTFGGNFLSMRAGLFVMDTLHKEKESGRLDERIEKFHLELEALCLEYSQIFVKKRGLGLMLGLEVRNEQQHKEILQLALQNQVVILRSGNNVLRFLPPLLINQDEIDEGFRRLRKGLSNGNL
ncbi:acetylornithine aminotransferase [Helicobacter enhydrae]|uniref:Acetylornithine aminotransferase n=1 Tax=Helicobacter enhydrae TaxID=222136 RepID=A0A1B1U3J9_9HELI|nr:aspartate aminotransferase family protein [Helicobacter enhydrae]ANV97343.1 acetylornithine aminotransferase [Helicobacter enhydrae]